MYCRKRRLKILLRKFRRLPDIGQVNRRNTVVFNSRVGRFNKKLRPFRANILLGHNHGNKLGAVGSFKWQLHIAVVIFIPGSAIQVMHYNKTEQGNIFVFLFMLPEMLHQHRQF